MDNHEQFFMMVDRVPRLAHLWNRETRELNAELFERELGVMSSGEVALAKFFAAVWFHNKERYGCDIVGLADGLDREHRQIIIDWLKAPFYP